MSIISDPEKQKLFDGYNREVQPKWHKAMENDKTSDDYKKGWTEAAGLCQMILFQLLLPEISIV